MGIVFIMFAELWVPFFRHLRKDGSQFFQTCAELGRKIYIVKKHLKGHEMRSYTINLDKKCMAPKWSI